MNTKIAVLAMMVLLSVSFVSANTYVIGKIYSDSFVSTISNAYIKVVCNSVVKEGNSLSDGTYAVGFGLAECPDKSAVTIYSSKDNRYGEKSATIDNSNATDFYTVANVELDKQIATPVNPGNSGGSGGSSLYYNCGNGRCDSGETASLCPRDCNATTLQCVENWQCTNWSACSSEAQTRICTDDNKCGTTNLKPTEQRVCVDEGSDTSSNGQSGLAGITGAVIGVLGTTWSVIIIIFIVGVIVIALAVFFKNRKKK